MKLKWEIQAAATGPYRSFFKRGWPTATFAGTTHMAARFECEDSYSHRQAKNATHEPLTVMIADYRRTEHGGSWKWRTLKERALTLDAAKQMAVEALIKHTEFLPPELQTSNGPL